MNDELCHHGILGMKWGVRRYQNKDGSLTSAGKKRHQLNFNENDRIGEKKETEVKRITDNKSEVNSGKE